MAEVLLLEVGGENVVTNPYFAVNTAGWFNQRSTLTRSTDWSYAGPASGLVTAAGTGSAYITDNMTLTNGATYTMIAIVYHELPQARAMNLWRIGDSGLPSVQVEPGAVTTLTGTFVGDGTSRDYAINMGGAPYGPPDAGDTYHVGYVGMIPGTYVGTPIPAIDETGTVLDGYSWSGTAHASTSTRAAASIDIPADSFPASLAIRYSDDDGDTWEHAYLTAEGAFGAHGEATFDTDHITIAPTSDRVLIAGVRGDSRVLTDAEKAYLEAAATWGWSTVPTR